MCEPNAGSGKSWSLTSSGSPTGCHSVPPLALPYPTELAVLRSLRGRWTILACDSHITWAHPSKPTYVEGNERL